MHGLYARHLQLPLHGVPVRAGVGQHHNCRLHKPTLLPHLAQRSRRSTVAKVMPGGKRDTGTALAGHLPQPLRRVRQAQQPRQVTIMRQVA